MKNFIKLILIKLWNEFLNTEIGEECVKIKDFLLEWTTYNYVLFMLLLKKFYNKLIIRVYYYKLFDSNLYFKKFLKNNANNLNMYNIFILTFLVIGLLELLFIFEYHYTYVVDRHFLFPNEISGYLATVASVCICKTLYSSWKQIKQKRNEVGSDKLWNNKYFATWFIKITNLFIITILICWVYWGKEMIIWQLFHGPRNWFMFETAILFYISWILYLIRYFKCWDYLISWYILALFILLILFLLILRDFIMIWGRDSIYFKDSLTWKRIESDITIYLSTPHWLIQHFFDYNKENINLFICATYNSPFNIDQNMLMFLKNDVTIINYKKYNHPILIKSPEWREKFLILYSLLNNDDFLFKNNDIFLKNKVDLYFLNSSDFLYNWYFIPRLYSMSDVILFPNRICYEIVTIFIWTLFLFLKLFCHIIIFIWWFNYVIYIKREKKFSYSFLSIFYFSIYCYLLISLLLFLIINLFIYQFLYKNTEIRPVITYSFNGGLGYRWIMSDIVDFIKSLWIQDKLEEREFITIYSVEHFDEVMADKLEKYLSDKEAELEEEKLKKKKKISDLIYIFLG